MMEVGEDDIPEQAVTNGALKFFGAKEYFVQLSGNDDFRLRHCQSCDTCGEYGNSSDKGRLVHCQACTVSYHQRCLGPRNSRDHLVTKVADRDFVLQCRRCINWQRKKEPTAPNQAKCVTCSSSSPASEPLRERKSTKQEHKEREENRGEDPITPVIPGTLNRPENVLFRCIECRRVSHFHHLPSKDARRSHVSSESSLEHLSDERFAQYSRNWTCKDCTDAPSSVDTIIAWRPTSESYVPGTVLDDINHDELEYLIKWKKLSLFNVTWMPGPWVWGVTAPVMRKAFSKREGANPPKMQTKDAVPEEALRIDIIFDVEYTNVVNVHTIKVDQARIKEVSRVLVKFKGLNYDDVVWFEPPDPNDLDRWQDFKSAYDDWVMGFHVHPPNSSTLSSTLSRLRNKDFGTKIKLEKQIDSLSGGELMDYQLEGINWIYYQWFRKQNALLADEMGLGKTIQIIGFLATLVQLHNCYPFLIVVPNSTCPNWRREIKQWAPTLRIVAYYGTAEARQLSQKYELFPEDAKDLRCHIVVTSYEAAQDDSFRRIFRGVHWTGLIVDEGQRLKNDDNRLFGALTALKIPFKILLTGTPLQNNPRELFNLLQFLDSSISAKALEEEYAELTKENVPRLHEMLRPFFLRRTKAEVLTFLPPIAQIIVPVSLTNLQKKLYRSILAKNPELIKSIFGTNKVKQTERSNLNNILMQLRKCLCHPFVYNKAIEELDPNSAIVHRNLIDASSKLRLLEIMLPKLQERGHRVLIFSQFLGMLDIVEDFLDGLGLHHQRLDGTISALQKQRRIDEFNAPDSSLFAFLLTTRAGGVGINLATADTVIILDPDFNPHQDIQALSRAHRIGQKKKVLVFQITTRSTAEEKIMQIGKKKMALDHVLIEQMDAEDNAGVDLESILRYGTEALFKDEDNEDDIRYDSASVDKLLDRSQMEDTLPGKDNSAESQFSFARVWANDRGALEEEALEDSSDHDADPSVWDAILREREKEVAEEAAAKAEAFGRGRRKRQTVDYTTQVDDEMAAGTASAHKRRGKQESDSDTDYRGDANESDADVDVEMGERSEEEARNEATNLGEPDRRSTHPNLLTEPIKEKKPFKRAHLPPPPAPPHSILPSNDVEQSTQNRPEPCPACSSRHPVGSCPLKRAGVEKCNLCGLAHYGHGRVCPHQNNIVQCQFMLEALKNSPEPKELKEAAKRRIVGIIGDLKQRKRRKREAQVAGSGPNNIPPDHPGLDGAFDVDPTRYKAYHGPPNGNYEYGGGLGGIVPPSIPYPQYLQSR